MHDVLLRPSHFITISQLLGEAAKVKKFFIIFGKFLRFFSSIKLVRLHYKIANSGLHMAKKLKKQP